MHDGVQQYSKFVKWTCVYHSISSASIFSEMLDPP